MKLETILSAGCAAAASACLSTQAPTLAVASLGAGLLFQTSAIRNSGLLPSFVAILTSLSGANCLEGGRYVMSGDSTVDEHLPVIMTTLTYSCTGLVVGERQILTAAHCPGYTNDIWTNDYEGFPQLNCNVKYSPLGDAAIVTFPHRITNAGSCVNAKLMSKKDYLDSKDAAPSTLKKACGTEKNLIVVGRGRTSAYNPIVPNYPKGGLFRVAPDGEGILKSDPRSSSSFDYEIPGPKHLSHMTRTDLSTVDVVRPGDSGGPIFGCNINNGKFELLGVVSYGSSEYSDSDMVFTNLANNPDLTKWFNDLVLTEERQSYCNGLRPISPYEFYPDKNMSPQNKPNPRLCIEKTRDRFDCQIVTNHCDDHIYVDVKSSTKFPQGTSFVVEAHEAKKTCLGYEINFSNSTYIDENKKKDLIEQGSATFRKRNDNVKLAKKKKAANCVIC